MRRRQLSLIVALLALAALGANARPARAEDRDARAARAHFQRAEKAFNLGKFDEALKGYEDAYEAKPLPGLLFNIAQCHRNLANPERAIFFYQRYLALEPTTPNRAMVEQLIAEEQKRLDERAPATVTPTPPTPLPTPTPPPEPPPTVLQAPPPAPAESAPPLYKRWWVWAAGAAVVGGVTAALLIQRQGPMPRGGLGPLDYR